MTVSCPIPNGQDLHRLYNNHERRQLHAFDVWCSVTIPTTQHKLTNCIGTVKRGHTNSLIITIEFLRSPIPILSSPSLSALHSTISVYPWTSKSSVYLYLMVMAWLQLLTTTGMPSITHAAPPAGWDLKDSDLNCTRRDGPPPAVRSGSLPQSPVWIRTTGAKSWKKINASDAGSSSSNNRREQWILTTNNNCLYTTMFEI